MEEKLLKDVLKNLSSKEKNALIEAVTVLWLDDSSDYINGLWDVIRVLIGEDFYHSDDFSLNTLYDLLKEKEPTSCPRCQSDDTYMVNDFLQKASELRKCENCGCEYEVIYDMKVKEIKINK